LKSWC